MPIKIVLITIANQYKFRQIQVNGQDNIFYLKLEFASTRCIKICFSMMLCTMSVESYTLQLKLTDVPNRKCFKIEEVILTTKRFAA